MKTQLRQQAIDLRMKERLSYHAIRERLGVAKSTLSYWLREYPLKASEILDLRRKNWQRNETKIERFRLAMREKVIEKDRVAYEKYRVEFTNMHRGSFFIAGLMLYLAEGGKTNPSHIVLTNTNINVLQFFQRWLIEFFNIDKSEFRAMLHLYENMNIEQERQFWKDGLGLKDQQFYKLQIRKLKTASFSYKSSFRHGTCAVYIFGVEKKREIMMAIKAYLDAYTLRGV